MQGWSSTRSRRAWRGTVIALAALAVAPSAHPADADLDPAFAGGFAFAHWATLATSSVKVAVDPASEAVFLAATGRVESGTDRRFAVAKFRADGDPDMGFGFQGLRTIDFDLVDDGYDSLLGAWALPAGRLMLLGTAELPGSAYVPAMARLTAAGNADPAFGVEGRRVVTSAPWPLDDLDIRLVAQHRGGYLFAGWCETGVQQRSAVVLRVDADGVPDADFGDAGWASMALPWPTYLESIAVDRDGRIALAGYEGGMASDPHVPVLARFLADGTPDASFGIGTGYVRLTGVPSPPPQAGWVGRALAADRDGSLLLSLTIDEDADAVHAGIVRVRANGTLDTGFGNAGLRPLDLENGVFIDALAVRSDGRILATGTIQPTGGGRDVLVARLRANGNLDTGFDGIGVARYMLASDSDRAQAIVSSAGRPVIAGYAIRGADMDGFALRLQSDLVFTDGMD